MTCASPPASVWCVASAATALSCASLPRLAGEERRGGQAGAQLLCAGAAAAALWRSSARRPANRAWHRVFVGAIANNKQQKKEKTEKRAASLGQPWRLLRQPLYPADVVVTGAAAASEARFCSTGSCNTKKIIRLLIRIAYSSAELVTSTEASALLSAVKRQQTAATVTTAAAAQHAFAAATSTRSRCHSAQQETSYAAGGNGVPDAGRTREWGKRRCRCRCRCSRCAGAAAQSQKHITRQRTGARYLAAWFLNAAAAALLASDSRPGSCRAPACGSKCGGRAEA